MGTLERYEIEAKEGWSNFSGHTMPAISFPSEWLIKIIPPFGGAMVRFLVALPSGTEKSIYFDAHDALGYVGQPYWEVYPYRGDVGRCLMGEVDRLLEMIADENND